MTGSDSTGGGKPPRRGMRKQDWIANQLRRVYDEALQEAIPPDMLELLAKLDEKKEGKAPATTTEGSKHEGEASEKLERPTEEELEPLIAAGLVGPRSLDPSAHISRPRMAHVFFGIYFFMTGLHGFHVLIGIGVWVWMLLKALKGQFGPNYFGPIDFTALYWHLVDLVWIYLFPLLYLIR